jgi:hypothetical protein
MKFLRSILILTLLVVFPFNKLSAQTEDEVTITATVAGCGAQILVKPEKRIPREGNFSNKNKIIFYDQFYQEIYKFENVETDKDGFSNIDICAQGLSTTPGIYSIYVKGYSHIGRLYIENKGFFNYTSFFDLAKNEDELLLAGDTIDHDYVNGLDLNALISKLYTDDLKTDLNRDGIVNSLDLSNQLYNLHKSGQLRL